MNGNNREGAKIVARELLWVQQALKSPIKNQKSKILHG